MLNGYADPNIFAYTSPHTNNCNSSFTSYCPTCAGNKYATQIRYICQIFDRYTWVCMCIYVPHMKSLTPTMWPEALYTDYTDAFSLHWLPLAIDKNQPITTTRITFKSDPYSSKMCHNLHFILINT